MTIDKLKKTQLPSALRERNLLDFEKYQRKKDLGEEIGKRFIRLQKTLPIFRHATNALIGAPLK